MILSEHDILRLAREYDKAIDKNVPLSMGNINVVGHRIMFFMAIRDQLGVPVGVTGVNAKLLRADRPNGVVPEDDSYYVDIAVDTHVPEIYAEVKDLLVTSVVMVDNKGLKQTGIALFKDIEIVEKFMNEKYDRKQGRAKLQLVVNNADAQETPDQQS